MAKRSVPPMSEQSDLRRVRQQILQSLEHRVTAGIERPAADTWSPVRLAAETGLCQWLAEKTANGVSVLGDLEADVLYAARGEEQKRAVVREAVFAQLKNDSEQLVSGLAELAKALATGQAERFARE